MSPRRAKAVHGREGGDAAAALRDHLIDAAERLLAERQVSEITTRDIARAAGVSDGVLYNYFADKNDLVLTALLRRFDHSLSRFNAGLPEPGAATVEENLNAYARASQDMIADALPLLIGLMTEPPLLRRFHDRINQIPFGPRQRIAEYLRDEQRLGRVPAGDVEAAADLLHGATMLRALGGDLLGRSQTDPDQQISALIATLMHGLNPPSPPEPAGVET